MALLNPVSFAGSLSIPKKNIFYHNQLLSSPDGLVANDPSTGQETTFVPIAYVMYALKNSLGIQSGWDGTTWNFTLPSASSKLKVPQSAPPLANAQRRIAVNGNAIENVPSVVAVDPSSGKDTTYMPIWYVMQLLQNDLGIPLQETYKTLMVFALFPIQRVRFRRGYSRLCDAPRASIPDQRIGTYACCRLR